MDATRDRRTVSADATPPSLVQLERMEQSWWAALRWLGENRGRIPKTREDRIAIRLFIQTLAGNLTAWEERDNDQADAPAPGGLAPLTAGVD